MKGPTFTLKSSFEDYYDHHFDAWGRDGDVVWRRHKATLTREEKFRQLLNLRIPLVMHGRARDLLVAMEGQGHKARDLFFIFDALDGGGGLEMVSGELVRGEGRGDEFTSAFVAGSNSRGERLKHPTTLRLSLVGEKQVWSRRVGEREGAWSTEEGRVERLVTGPTTHIDLDHLVRSSPVFALDFIPFCGRLVAFNLDPCPTLSHTPVSKALTPLETANHIKAWLIQAQPTGDTP